MSGFLKDADNRKVFDDLTRKLFPLLPTGSTGCPYLWYAAGKSGIKKHLRGDCPTTAVLDGDEYRKLHPDYRSIAKNDPDNIPHSTQSFVYELLDHLKKYAPEHKKSYALETTFHDDPKTEETFAEARRNGYRTELYVLAVFLLGQVVTV